MHLGDQCNSKNTSVFISYPSPNILDHRQWSDIMFFNLQSLSSPSFLSATLLPPLLSPPTQKQIHCLSFYVSILLHHFLRRFNAVPSANRLFSTRSSGNYLYAYFFDAPDRMRRHQNEDWNNLSDMCRHRLSDWQLCSHIQIASGALWVSLSSRDWDAEHKTICIQHFRCQMLNHLCKHSFNHICPLIVCELFGEYYQYKVKQNMIGLVSLWGRNKLLKLLRLSLFNLRDSPESYWYDSSVVVQYLRAFL